MVAARDEIGGSADAAEARTRCCRPRCPRNGNGSLVATVLSVATFAIKLPAKVYTQLLIGQAHPERFCPSSLEAI